MVNSDMEFFVATNNSSRPETAVDSNCHRLIALRRILKSFHSSTNDWNQQSAHCADLDAPMRMRRLIEYQKLQALAVSELSFHPYCDTQAVLSITFPQ
ncbi:hypothetical protein TNIN_419101 [Trichonephila inaurata madagascariensis]|uniref:Uncharacterized protein n=1 Tax=Trichonephila inaurata madagascariensis TaxID=2747483 RepID=A0A8X6Y652_9ARAC|nr:hypothetical protein TNIN_419101 [Trichonephila inaurata madagascariensis]